MIDVSSAEIISMSDDAYRPLVPFPRIFASDRFASAGGSAVNATVWPPATAADAVYDRLMNIAFVGMFLMLCGLEVVKRLYLGGSVFWTLHSAGFRANAPLLALFAIHWLRAESRKERVLLFGSAAVIAFLFERFLAHNFASSLSLLALSLVNATSVTNLAFIVRERGVSSMRLRTMRDAWFVPIVVLLCTPMIDLTAHFGPPYDAHIFHFEELLGIRMESVVYLVVAACPFGHAAMEWIYRATAALFAIPLMTARSRRNALTLAMVGVGLLGYGFYWLCPAVGIQFPAYYHSIWAGHALPSSSFADPVAFAGMTRNTVPSIHAACAYLLMFNAWRFSPVLRRSLIAFGILTLISAIDIGQHWSTDLLTALPFTIAIMALTEPNPALTARTRMPIVICGYALTLLWVLVLRGGSLSQAHSAVLGWTAVGLTLATSILLLRRLNTALAGAPVSVNELPFKPFRVAAAVD